MRLKKIWISEYKNLKDFTLELKEDNFLEIFVGKNASGKSNLFEAIILIFKHISKYYHHKNTASIEFDYEIEYIINDKAIKVLSRSGIVYLDDLALGVGNRILVPWLPEKIIVYYSGHTSKINNVMLEVLDFQQNVIGHDEYNTNLRSDEKTYLYDVAFLQTDIINLDRSDLNIMLFVLLIQLNNSISKEQLCNYLNIEDFDSVLHLILKKPLYPNQVIASPKKHDGSMLHDGSSQYDGAIKSLEEPMDMLDPKTYYWHLEGKLREFLDIFKACSLDNGQIRTEGYQAELDEWFIYSDTHKLKEKLKDKKIFEIFEMFSCLKIIGMFKSLSFNVKLKNGDVINSNNFSDGQLQSIYIFALTEIFKEKKVLVLLDEPDAFLHPEWQFQFLNQINAISAEAQKGNHILMSSHSAVTMINHPQKKINYIDFNEKKQRVCCSSLPKRFAIEKLSAEMIRFAEEEQLLSIVNNIQIEDKAVMFVEGITDPMILKEAWYRLYPEEEIPFIPMFSFGHKYIPRFLSEEKIYKEIGERGLFALFDFDEGFASWDGLKKNGDNIIKEDVSKGLCLQIRRYNQDAFAFMMPLPANHKLKNQMFDGSGKHFKNKTLCEIEHLFYCTETEQYFEEIEERGGGKSFHFKGEKIPFAKDIVPSLDSSYFEIFRPMFEFIITKTSSN